MMLNSWPVLLPPFFVLMIALYTKQLVIALGAGIIMAGFIGMDTLDPIKAFTLIISRVWQQLTDIDNVYTYLFLVLIGSLIVLLNKTGGANAFARLFTKHLRSRRMVETSSFLLSCTLFLDDYLSNLTVGHVMRPLSDAFFIPRAKLAFLVHSMTGPLVILAPLSSWAAMIVSQLENAGIQNVATENTKVLIDPFYLYVKTIPFIFYSLLLIASVIFIIRMGISFGPMKNQEDIAHQQHNLFGGKEAPRHVDNNTHDEVNESGSLLDFLIPLVSLIVSVIVGIAHSGGYYLCGGSATFIQAIKNNQQPFLVLAKAGLITFCISTAYALLSRRIRCTSLPSILGQGTLLMISPIIMVFLASTLGLLLKNDLHTGQYLASILIGNISITILPCLFYIVSLVITIATGSAWGTIALMLPIAIPLVTTMSNMPLPVAPDQLPILYPVLGAIFSGAVCGDHISPVSETTIMAASSAGSYIMDHVKTQFVYSVPAIVYAFVAFVIAGYIPSYSYSLIAALGTSSTLCLGTLYILNKKAH